ncbi:MAG: hypothetical protein ACJ76V_08625 [Thermoleophilaceae bacterium]
MTFSLKTVAAAALAAALIPAGTALADHPDSERTTYLLSRSLSGSIPNGPSRNPAVSHDQRIARVIAFESDGSDLTPGDANGATDVFVVRRAAPWGQNGTFWTMGATTLVSKGLGGQPANGRSYRPAVDGDSHHQPSCVAFVSDASNLVPGDTNGKADAFVYNLNSGKITRVSVDSAGKQSNGTTSEVAVDGACERAAFVSDATNLALKGTKNAAWRSARTSGTKPGVKQVYVHVIKGTKHDAGFKGLTFLGSASAKGKAGNADSFGVDFARAGKDVVFASNASNLTKGDGNATSDIYERSFDRKYMHVAGKGVQTFTFQTTLVSAGGGHTAGNGASSHPVSSDDGRYVAYETLASNLGAGDANGVSDVLEASVNGKTVKQAWVSRSNFSGLGNGPSNHPVISGAGEFVLFDSDANNLKPSASVADDSNGVRDVFLWNRPTGNVSLESRNSANGYLSTPSQHPATSSRGNYVPFESADPNIDLAIAARLSSSIGESAIPKLIDPDAIVPGPVQSLTGDGAPDGALQQVYLRYLGQK